ncbi:hypothetical protein JAAARDRAFT_27681 [Jaapia argillacea MUCL 33604]|uniref:Thioesterase domain-containing protein n=1 Tax=Jaapia argillacea MUCL 33604 TaxID=933084 RepID=A0A067QAG5_9AGAM|nr:hypothetical protein JAAARDRAFT_27681 [Jaapia argillacea MUCL 33604]
MSSKLRSTPKPILTLAAASQIPGSAPAEIKQVTHQWLRIISSLGGFGGSIAKRLVLNEVGIRKVEDEEGKEECRVVFEVEVTPDMLNGSGSIHGACSAYLVDTCTSLPISALNKYKGNIPSPGVSQAINMVYHSPAGLADKLRVVCTTLSVGARVMSSRCEIWNQTHHRLVASGVHIKMEPSAPTPKL